MFSSSRLFAVAAAVFVTTACTAEYDVKPADDPVDLPPTGELPIPSIPGEDPDPNEPVEPDQPIALGAVQGRICAPDGTSWVSGALVQSQHALGISQTTTDGDGWFLLDGLPTGTVTIDITKGSFSTQITVDVVEGLVTQLAVEECIEQGSTEIAVFSGDYDNIEDVLDVVGIDFDMVNGQGSAGVDFLRNPGMMAQYDVLFFNCGMADDWLSYDAEITTNIRDYVTAGGSIYASDWAYYLVEASFRDQNTFLGDDLQPGSAKVGMDGFVTANVIDPNMQALLGSNQAEINYDLSIWAAMQSADSSEVLLEGTFDYIVDEWTGQTATTFAPLATRFSYGNGSVIYTSFHNENQATVDMAVLLQDIVLSL